LMVPTPLSLSNDLTVPKYFMVSSFGQGRQNWPPFPLGDV
jgi:hypothetical protein